MALPGHYTVKIDQLPDVSVAAASDDEALRKIGEMIRSEPHLAVLHDDEPVLIKRPDGSVWVRDGTVASFREPATR